MRRAIYLLDRMCTLHGGACGNHNLQLHHLIHWENDGPTSVRNGTPVCSPGHHQAHHLGLQGVRGHDNKVRWYTPDGALWTPAITEALAIGTALALQKLADNPALIEHWDGSPLDAWALDCLINTYATTNRAAA